MLINLLPLIAAPFIFAFAASPNPTTTPVTQNRDHTYDWQKRHQQVLERNKAVSPEVIMIGDSINPHFPALQSSPRIRLPF